MPIKILMPALSPTMTEGNLARWTKKEGDKIKPGEVIAEIETDKATMEVEAVDEGRIGKILVVGGSQGVKVNDVIAILLEDGESEIPAAFLTGGTLASANTSVASQPSVAAMPTSAPTAHQHTQIQQGGRVIASPLARRIAEQRNVDLRHVTGTGSNGRIIRNDVEQAAARYHTTAPVSAAAPQGINAIDYANKLGLAYELIPHSMTRKVIAKRLTESKQTVPHFYLTVDCQIDRLLDLRKQLNETTDKNKVSVNDFIIRAVAVAMRQVPAANASWSEEGVLLYKDVDVSVAVATPGGLITPIIKNADQKSIQAVSIAMKDLANKAKDNKLKPEEFMGGGFTLSNLGMFGIKQFSAILNPPQGCILAVGAGEQRPIVRDGELAVATVMTCTLSVDHRVVDGAIGAEFLSVFKKLIEEPIRLFV